MDILNQIKLQFKSIHHNTRHYFNYIISNKLYKQHIKATSSNREKYILSTRDFTAVYDTEIIGYVVENGDRTQEWIWAWAAGPHLFSTQIGRSLDTFKYSFSYEPGDNDPLRILLRTPRFKINVNNLFINAFMLFITNILNIELYVVQKYKSELFNNNIYVVKIFMENKETDTDSNPPPPPNTEDFSTFLTKIITANKENFDKK